MLIQHVFWIVYAGTELRPYRRLTQLTMFLASALTRGIHPTILKSDYVCGIFLQVTKRRSGYLSQITDKVSQKIS